MDVLIGKAYLKLFPNITSECHQQANKCRNVHTLVRDLPWSTMGPPAPFFKTDYFQKTLLKKKTRFQKNLFKNGSNDNVAPMPDLVWCRDFTPRKRKKNNNT